MNRLARLVIAVCLLLSGGQGVAAAAATPAAPGVTVITAAGDGGKVIPPKKKKVVKKKTVRKKTVKKKTVRKKTVKKKTVVSPYKTLSVRSLGAKVVVPRSGWVTVTPRSATPPASFVATMAKLWRVSKAQAAKDLAVYHVYSLGPATRGWHASVMLYPTDVTYQVSVAQLRDYVKSLGYKVVAVSTVHTRMGNVPRVTATKSALGVSSYHDISTVLIGGRLVMVQTNAVSKTTTRTLSNKVLLGLA